MIFLKIKLGCIFPPYLKHSYVPKRFKGNSRLVPSACKVLVIQPLPPFAPHLLPLDLSVIILDCAAFLLFLRSMLTLGPLHLLFMEWNVLLLLFICISAQRPYIQWNLLWPYTVNSPALCFTPPPFPRQSLFLLYHGYLAVPTPDCMSESPGILFQNIALHSAPIP